MITAKFCLCKMPENLQKDKNTIKKELHNWITFDSIKIITTEDNDHKAILYDGVNDEPDEIFLSNYAFIFINEFEKYSVNEFINAYKFLTNSKNFYNKIVDADDLHRILHNIVCEEVDNKCIEMILGNSQIEKSE